MIMVALKTLGVVKCGLCEFSSKRITSVERHILEEHGLTAQELFDKLHGKTYCRCGCGKETTWLNWKNGYSTMLKGHNASIYNVYDEEKASEIAATRGTNWRGKEHRSKGKTKETDEWVAARAIATSIGRKEAFERGELASWSKGKTKETDPRVAALAETIKEGFASGEVVPWAKGKTKETDERIAAMAERVALSHQQASLRKRLDDLKRLDEDQIRARVEEGNKFKIIGDLASYVNDATPNIKVSCTTCGNQTHSSLRQLQWHRCFNCDPSGSAAQANLADWVESLNVEVKRNVRDVIKGTHRGAEIDIYVPQHKLAIEFNGLYWHCSIHKPDNYHQNKSDRCNELGIKLFHVFEDEWKTRPEIVKSMISARLGLSSRVWARKCLIVELKPTEKRDFFEANHIDGDTASTAAFGLSYEGETVMAISLRKPFHKKHAAAFEVARVASRVNTTVVGGLNRLSKKALEWAQENGRNTIVSYVDTRHGSSGESWTNAGWSMVDETPPRFWWTNTVERFNRFKFRANKERNLTEAQVAEEAGVVKIWGCKNLRFELGSLNDRA